MNSAIISAVIGLLGVGIAGIVSYIVAARQISQKYSEFLYQSRLQVYPDLYRLISDLAKHVRYREASIETLRESAAALDVWDSAHALLLSPIATKNIFDLRFSLRSLVAEQRNLADEQTIRSILTLVSDLENALKTELGIYHGTGFHNPKRTLYVSDQIALTLKK